MFKHLSMWLPREFSLVLITKIFSNHEAFIHSVSLKDKKIFWDRQIYCDVLKILDFSEKKICTYIHTHIHIYTHIYAGSGRSNACLSVVGRVII